MVFQERDEDSINPCREAIEHLEPEILLAGKIVVERSLWNVRLLQDGFDSGGVEALSGYDSHPCLQYFRSGIFCGHLEKIDRSSSDVKKYYSDWLRMGIVSRSKTAMSRNILRNSAYRLSGASGWIKKYPAEKGRWFYGAEVYERIDS
jgi:hypothetical protein